MENKTEEKKVNHKRGRPTKNPGSYYHKHKEDDGMHVKLQLHKWQMRAWKSTKRFIGVFSGTQGGKTTFGLEWLIREINQDPTADYLVAAPTYKMLMQSTLPRFLDKIRKLIPGKWNEQNKEYRLKAGGRVFARSTEDPDRLEAMTLKAAWLDEAGLMKGKVWYIMMSRLAVLKGRLLITTTPYNMGWLYADFFKKRDTEEFEVIQFASCDSPWFPIDEYERLKKSLPEAEFRRRFGGQFVKNEGLVYADFDRSKHVYNYETTTLPKELFRFIGMDLGYTSPTAAIFCAIDVDGTIWIYDEYYERQGRLSHHAEKMKDMGYNRQIKVWADRSAAQEIAELSALGLLIAPATEKDVNIGCSKISQLFKTGKIRVSSKCKNLIDELEMYSWKPIDDVEVKTDKVVKKHDHCVDALRYGITSTSFMLPQMRNPILNMKPVIKCDPTTGYPTGYGEESCEFIFERKLKLTDGTFFNCATGRKERRAV